MIIVLDYIVELFWTDVIMSSTNCITLYIGNSWSLITCTIN